MGNRITRTVLFAASALLSMNAFGAGAARFGTLRNSDWIVTNAWQAVSNKTHDLIIDLGQEASLPPNWSNVSNAAMSAVQSLQPAYDYTDNALILFSSTGSVFRSLSYGTPNRWTDATGCVWEIGSRYDNDWVSDTNRVTHVSWESAGYEENPDLWAIYFTVDGSILTQVYSPPPSSTQTNRFISASDWSSQYEGAFDFNIYRSPHEATNLIGLVALTNDISNAISTNNPAFVSAVLAAPIVGADPSDLSELAEYGSYGTVGAAILALIAGLAALKRRMTAAETAIEEKPDFSDLPYALVVPGEWEFAPFPDGVTSVEFWGYSSGDGWGISVNGDAPVYAGLNEPNALELEWDVYGDGTCLITATRASLPGHLCDRAVNAVAVSTTMTLTLPAANPGHARDLYVRLTVSATSAVTWVVAQGESWDAMGAPPSSLAAGTYLYRFTEVAPGVWHCEDMLALVGLEAALAAINGGVAP